MAQRILNRVLRALDSIYSIATPGPRAPEQIDTESPLQLVHDVSREAEIGTGVGNFGGFLEGTVEIDAGVGAGVDRETLAFGPTITDSPLDQISDERLEEQYWAWCMDTWATIENDGNQGNLVAAQLFVWNGQSRRDFMGWSDDLTFTAHPVFQTAGAGSGGGTDLPADGPRTSLIRSNGYAFRPFPVPIRSGVANFCQGVVNRSGDLGVVRFGILWWVGRRGVMPPGMR